MSRLETVFGAVCWHLLTVFFQHDVEKILVFYGYIQIWWDIWQYLWPDLGARSRLGLKFLFWKLSEDVRTRCCQRIWTTLHNQKTKIRNWTKKTSVTGKTHNGQKKCSYGFPGIWTRAIILHLHAHTWAHIHTWVHTGKNIFLCPRLCWQVCACSSYSCYLLCCVLVGMCLAAASWQSKNGLLVTLPPSQPVAGLRVHHLQLLPAVAQLCCLMVEMRMAAASWQSKNCLLRYSRSKLPILIKMCCGGSAGPVRSRPRSRPCSIGIPYCSIPVPDPDHPRTTPDPLPGQMAGSHINCSQTILCAWVMGVYILATQTQYTPWGPLSFKSGRWDLRDRSEAEWTASHGTQWVTLATGRVLASARALAFQGKAALNRCTIRIACRWEVKTSGS